MRRCNSTGQGRSRILPRGRTIGAPPERRNRTLAGMFEWLCRGVSSDGDGCVISLTSATVYVGSSHPELEDLLRGVTEIGPWDSCRMLPAC